MAASDDLIRAIQAGPPGGAGASSVSLPKPIGVSEGYVPPRSAGPALSGPMGIAQAERRSVMGGSTREPYYDGAEAAPQVLSPEKRARVQTLMAQAGLFGKTEIYRVGRWDDVTRKTYRKVLEHANYLGVDADTALQDLLSAPMMRGDGTAVGAEALQPDPGNVIRKSNPLSLEAQVQQTARERLGRKLRKNEISKFVSLYQGMEASYGKRLNDADERRAEGADVTVTEQASPDVAADQFIDSNFAQEAAGESAYDYLGALRNLIGG